MKYAIMRFPNFRRKALTLSYDDGVKFDKRLISILDQYGLKATFNINGGLFGEKSEDRRLTKEEAVALYANSSHEVAIHGYKHLSLAEVDKGMAAFDVIEDRKVLEETFGRVIQGMAYANGSYDDKVVALLKDCGVLYARTVISTEDFTLPQDWLRMPATCHHANPRLMELAKKFVEEQEPAYVWARAPKLFYLWGHSYEFDDGNNWEIIEEFAKYVGRREEIWYATNGEIYEYVKAFESLSFSVAGTLVYNPSAIDVYIRYNGKNVLIPSGETVQL
jgi:hypothetical protein